MDFPKLKSLPSNGYFQIIMLVAFIGLVWYFWDDISYHGGKLIGKDVKDDDLDMDKVLSEGSKGKEVGRLQSELNEMGANLTVDLRFGKKTLAALQEYTGQDEISLNGLAAIEAMANGSTKIVEEMETVDN